MAVGSINPASQEQTIASSLPAPLELAPQSKAAVSLKHKRNHHESLPLLAGIFHVIASLLTLSVFFWHLTPAAAKLPGSKAFGWFFKFLTFWGWTLQTMQFSLCVVQRCTSKTARLWRPLTKFSDDFSCATFTVAILITVQFWVLHLVTGGLVERSKDRPPWLGFSVHVLNACLALTDVILSNPRSFSKRTNHMLAIFTVIYSSFLCLCRYLNGKYPYPFMNKMHPVAAFPVMLCVSLVVLNLMCSFGASISQLASKALSKPEVILDAPGQNGKHAKTRQSVIQSTNGRQGGPVLRNGKNGPKDH